ncbi:MAG: HD domain-containing protein, partial [Anaerolineae bacterium]
MSLGNTALTAFLREESPEYYGKVLELRAAVEGWLAYIPVTFPHYTRHTVDHSDEIVRQVSKLLFRDDGPRQPVVPLSAVEAYVLAAAAYLHDAGMVVSDREKAEMLGSSDWRDWTSADGGGAQRWQTIEELRHGKAPEDAGMREFLAGVQTRFLVAEFVRRRHHERAASVLTQHQHTLGRFA